MLQNAMTDKISRNHVQALGLIKRFAQPPPASDGKFRCLISFSGG